MADHHQHPTSDDNRSMHHYVMFGVNMAVGLAIMYAAMFTMIDGLSDFYNNLNMLYMAITMAAPMGIVMLATMGSMYKNRAANTALYVILVLLTVASFIATRSQAAIGDNQFISSMIPHHSGAILMCREAKLLDGELVNLCREIIRSQRAEVEQMKAIRERFNLTAAR